MVDFGPQALQLARSTLTANDTAAPNVFNTDESNAALRPTTADLTGPILSNILGQNQTNAALLNAFGPGAQQGLLQTPGVLNAQSGLFERQAPLQSGFFTSPTANLNDTLLDNGVESIFPQLNANNAFEPGFPQLNANNVLESGFRELGANNALEPGLQPLNDNNLFEPGQLNPNNVFEPGVQQLNNPLQPGLPQLGVNNALEPGLQPLNNNNDIFSPDQVNPNNVFEPGGLNPNNVFEPGVQQLNNPLQPGLPQLGVNNALEPGQQLTNNNVFEPGTQQLGANANNGLGPNQLADNNVFEPGQLNPNNVFEPGVQQLNNPLQPGLPQLGVNNALEPGLQPLNNNNDIFSPNQLNPNDVFNGGLNPNNVFEPGVQQLNNPLQPGLPQLGVNNALEPGLQPLNNNNDIFAPNQVNPNNVFEPGGLNPNNAFEPGVRQLNNPLQPGLPQLGVNNALEPGQQLTNNNVFEPGNQPLSTNNVFEPGLPQTIYPPATLAANAQAQNPLTTNSLENNLQTEFPRAPGVNNEQPGLFQTPQARNANLAANDNLGIENPNAQRGPFATQELNAQQEREVQVMAQNERQVRADEETQRAAAQGYATGTQLRYEIGPDGRRYAVEAEASFDLSPVRGDPAATLRKMEVITQAATTGTPSVNDRNAAARADQLATQARAQIAAERYAEAQALEQR